VLERSALARADDDHGRSELEVAERVARVVISYTCCPAAGVCVTDGASVRRLVRTYVLPSIAVPA
jgi:hypothetical protein